MPPEPKADAPRCDLLGCGMFADRSTDGSEKDSQGLGRKAVPFLNVCTRHENWPFSQDAKVFTMTEKYISRLKKGP